jgi:hypothetical protein
MSVSSGVSVEDRWTAASGDIAHTPQLPDWVVPVARLFR